MVKRTIGSQSAGSAQKSGAGNPIAVLVVHGPNLNMLGEREPEVYGHTRLADIDKELKQLGRELEMKVETFQSNSEGAIVDRIQSARGKCDVLLLNPGAYTHTSVAIRDAIRPSIFRSSRFICPTCTGARRFVIIRRLPTWRTAVSWALAPRATAYAAGRAHDCRNFAQAGRLSDGQ